MKLTGFLPALLVLLLPGLSFTARGDQNDPRLEQLFITLQNSQNEAELSETEASIWSTWLDSGNPEVDQKMRAAAELMESGRLPAAEKIYSQVIEKLPGFSEGWNKRATVRFYMRDFDGSMADIGETLRLEPRHFGAIWGLGMILGELGDYERAILAFERLLEIKPNSRDARPRIEFWKRELAGESV